MVARRKDATRLKYFPRSQTATKEGVYGGINFPDFLYTKTNETKMLVFTKIFTVCRSDKVYWARVKIMRLLLAA